MTMNEEEAFRVTVLYRGRVQGVGFRWNVRSVSEDFAVAGYVKNLPDGTVEMLAEGEEAEVRKFLVGIEKRMGRFIAGSSRDERFGPARHSSFTIAY